MSYEAWTPEDLAVAIKLYLPFEPWEWSHMQIKNMDFVGTKREAIENRLNDVLGPLNWKHKFKKTSNYSVECWIQITYPSGRKVTRHDAGAVGDGFDSEGNNETTGYTNAFKRAASWHGPGHAQRKVGVPEFARAAYWQEWARIVLVFGIEHGLTYDGPPEYMAAAQKARSSQPAPRADAPPPARELMPPVKKALPTPAPKGPAITTGMDLYNLAKREGILADVTAWGRTRGFRPMMKIWSQGQIAQALDFIESLKVAA